MPDQLSIIMKRFYVTFLLTVFASIGAVAAQTPSEVIQLNPVRAGHAATLLNSGNVLITGGVNEDVTLDSALLYNSGSHNLVATGTMTSARAFHTSTLLPDGRVLLTGGELNTGQKLKTAEIYDPTRGLFTQVSHFMSIPRTKHTATLLQDGRVLIVGGKKADLFDPNTQIFTATTTMPTDRSSHADILLPDGSVLITGGYVGRTPARDAWVFNPSTNAFTLLSAVMLIPRANHAMTLMLSGKVLVTGGFSGTSPHDQVDIFDPVRQTFTAARKMLYHRSGHRAVLVGGWKSARHRGYHAGEWIFGCK